MPGYIPVLMYLFVVPNVNKSHEHLQFSYHWHTFGPLSIAWELPGIGSDLV